MQILKSEERIIQCEEDLSFIRKLVKENAIQLKFSLLNQTKLVTAASELTRNVLKYAKTGIFKINIINTVDKEGVELIFKDQGPGISDIHKVMKGGYTTGGGLGLGLSGSSRLANEFDVQSEVGKGTCVKMIFWK